MGHWNPHAVRRALLSIRVYALRCSRLLLLFMRLRLCLLGGGIDDSSSKRIEAFLPIIGVEVVRLRPIL